ncbi:MAG TPA: tryptophan-rich sensory protein [Clostridiaceae bacterium]|nr:tryptophan-rich sensory protein [Clostridiaceae bacterium]
MNRTKKSWITAILFAATLAVNTLGALGIINGMSQKEVSDRYQTLITPASSTFSIWSVIYSLLIISIILLIAKSKDDYYNKAMDEIAGLFWLSCLINIAWIVCFSFVLIEVSVALILLFTVNLALICRRLLAIQDKKRRWLLPVTFGLYTGWLFIASVVNIAAMLVKLEWGGFGLADEIWGILILAVAVVLVILVMLNLHNAAFPLPAAWAYLGIYMNLHSAEGFGGQYGTLQIVCIIGLVVLIGAAAIQLYRNRFSVLKVK